VGNLTLYSRSFLHWGSSTVAVDSVHDWCHGETFYIFSLPAFKMRFLSLTFQIPLVIWVSWLCTFLQL
jgi:hypothetical protein